jgi:hypothetical protein
VPDHDSGALLKGCSPRLAEWPLSAGSCGHCERHRVLDVDETYQLQHRQRSLGLSKRVARAYRYYLTRLGRAAIAAACSLTQFHIVPALVHTA